jgi:predicted transcriptional regulator
MIATGATSRPDVRVLRELRAEGLSIRQIAARTGWPRSTVGDLLRGSEMMRDCALCGSAFWTGNANQKFCCSRHRVKKAKMRAQA